MLKTHIWDAVCETDPKYTKAFNRGGGFRGTATNATYLHLKATTLWGPCGKGWGYEVVDEKYAEGAWIDERNREVIHVVRVRLWYGSRENHVEQFGQTTFVGRNKNGVYTDEEAPKKSLTDAVSKCLAALGFSADIFQGLYDDNKYVAAVTKKFAAAEDLLGQAVKRVNATLAEAGCKSTEQADAVCKWLTEGSVETVTAARGNLDAAMAVVNAATGCETPKTDWLAKATP